MAKREQEPRSNDEKLPYKHKDDTPRERAFSKQELTQLVIYSHGESVLPQQLRDRYAPLFGKNRELPARKKQHSYSFASFSSIFAEFGDSHDSEKMLFIKHSQAEYMAELLFRPSADRAIILTRQELLKSLILCPNLEKILEIKDRILALLEGVHEFNSQYSYSQADERTLIEMLYDGEIEVPVYDDPWPISDDFDQTESLLEYVQNAVQQIKKGLHALDELVALNDPNITQIWPEMVLFIQEARRILNILLPKNIRKGGDRQDFPYIRFHPYFDTPGLHGTTYFSQLYTFQKYILDPFLLQFGALLEFAKKIKDEEWCQVTFDCEQPNGFIKGLNIARKKEGQVPNDSLPDLPLTVLSGANSSGKSFALTTAHLAQIASQSLGFLPAIRANMYIYDSIVYLDRSATNSEANLSAFMQEVTYIKSALGKMQGSVHVCIDEGYSTTSPEDQMKLLFATVQYIIHRKGRVIVATHNDLLLDQIEAANPGALFHLAVSVNSAGELERHFLLRAGRNDSRSFEIAKTRRFDINVLTWVQKFLQHSEQYPLPTQHKLRTTIEKYSMAEREQLKKKPSSLEQLFPTEQNNPHFLCLSVDRDWNPERLFLRSVSEQEQPSHNPIWKGLFSIREREELAGLFVLNMPTLSSSEVLERQQMFRELLHEDRFIRLSELIDKAVSLDESLRTLCSVTSHDLSKKLNPVEGSKSGQFHFSEDLLKYSWAYLNIHHKLHPNSFSHQHLLDELYVCLTTFEHLLSRCEKGRLYSDTIMDSGERDAFVSRFKQFTDAENLTADDLFQVSEQLFNQLWEIKSDLPEIAIQDLQAQLIEDELTVLEKGSSLAAAILNIREHLKLKDDLVRELLSIDTVYLHQVAHFIETVVNKELLKIYDRSQHIQDMSENDHPSSDKTILLRSLERIEVLCFMASAMKEHHFCGVEFNQTGEIRVRQMFQRLHNEKQDEVKNSLVIGAQEPRVHMLTGPNGSGKTVFEKTSVQTILFALATGHAPAEFATMPFFDSVVYLDRILGQADSQFSSFTQELEYWSQILKRMEYSQSAFICVDEAFSTTSPIYQAAFTFGIIAQIVQSSHFLQLSTHNHEIVDFLLKAPIEIIRAYHFLFSFWNEKVQYHHTIAEGHAQSYAIQVAQMMGLPAEIVTRARTW